jgi:allantoinase
VTELDLVVTGNLVLPDRILLDGALGVLHGRIVSVSQPATAVPDAAQTLEAGDALVLPGVVDTHVHCLSSGEEGISRATAAAAAGGVTTIVDMPYDAGAPVFEIGRLREKIEAVCAEARVDVGLYGSMAKDDGLEALPEQLDSGVLAFKFSLFETDPLRFPRIRDGDLEAAFELLAPSQVPIVLHCELQEIIERRLHLAAELEAERPEAHAASRPPVSETGAVVKALELALWTGARVHIAHVTHPHGFRLIDFYRELGAHVSGETCVQYLVLSSEDVKRMGAIAKVNPPIREPTCREGLWAALTSGSIETVSTDHAPWPLAHKQRPMLVAASGVAGLETSLALLHTEAVHRGVPLPALCEAIAGRPADLFGLGGRKGRLSPGYDADFVIFDTHERWTFTVAGSRSSARHSPYEGRELVGRVCSTYVRGQAVYAEEQVVAQPGYGRWLARESQPRQRVGDRGSAHHRGQ